MLEAINKGATTESHPVPLLFVHGAWHAAWCWDEHFLDYFADKGFHAVAVSLRGHGTSPLSKPLNSCSLADYVDDVATAIDIIGSQPVLIGHSLGCFVIQKYLEKHGAPAAVLMAPATPQGLRRIALRLLLRHPWNALRANTFGDPADVINTPALAREFLFCAGTPEPIVKSCAARMEPESARAGLDAMLRRLNPNSVTTPILVLGAKDDGSRIEGDVSAAARTYETNAELFPNLGHDMMLEPGWRDVADRICEWLAAKSL